MIHVNTTQDLKDAAQNSHCSAGQITGGPCSLRAAIFEASHHTAGSVTIEVPPGVYKLTRTKPDDEGEAEDHYGDLDFPPVPEGESTNITIAGTGEWDNPSVIDANFIDRVMEIGKNQQVHLKNLVLKNGLAKPHENQHDAYGGGLKISHATVTLFHVRLTNNEARDSHSVGGGIYSEESPLTLSYCELDHNESMFTSVLSGTYHSTPTNIWASTIHHNTVDYVYGRHIEPGNELVMTNSTISDNQGGDYIIKSTAPILIQNSTLISRDDLGIISCSGDNNLRLRFSILQVIPNSSGESGVVCSLSQYSTPSLGGNIFSDESCNPKASDQVVSYSEMMLGPLGNYGGWTPTIPLHPGSPAVDFGSNRCTSPDGDPLGVDQRDKRRDSRCDSGAFELQEGEDPTVVYLPLIFK